MTRKLGEVQASCLRSLAEHGGTWHSGCGWIWDNQSGTTKIMNSLVRRGYATREDRPYPTMPHRTRPIFKITLEGRQKVDQLRLGQESAAKN